MLKPYIEIVKFLLEKNSFLKTEEIQRFLENQGLLEKSKASNRRLLQKYLERLEYEGYIVRKYENIKGRKSQEWRINPKSFQKIIGISEEEFISLLIMISFIPDDYRNLDFLSDIKNIINRTFLEITDDKREIIENAFKYVPEFHEKFSKIDKDILNKLFKGIFEKKYLKIIYNDKWKKIVPIKIFLYQGILYLSAINEENKKINLKVSCIKSVVETSENAGEFFIKKYIKQNFGFEDEKPFIFAVDIPKWYIKCEDLNTTKILNTQFYAQENGENIKVYLIGYTGFRFPSRILVPQIEKIYKPDKEIINKAKEFKNKLKENYENVTFSLNKNLDRFYEFIEELEYYLEQRNNLLKTV